MNQKTLDLLALSLVPGIGTRSIYELIKRAGSASRVLQMSRSQLKKNGIGLESSVAICSGYARKEADKTVEKSRASGTRVISFESSDYPDLLRQIYDPPVILYVRGCIELLAGPAIAIVGARRCSVYGKQVAHKMAEEIARQGLVVVSGLARGIDTKSHQGALSAGGSTVAVLGTGIDVEYPSENRKIQREIAEKGCLVTEFPFGVFPAPQNFPIRNRIISGLSLGTLIPEAGEFSGSLITARLTLEQNRDLWAVPGNITNPESIGPNLLIKQGAQPVTCVQDILNGLPLPVLKELKNLHQSEEELRFSPDQSAVLKCLSVNDARHFDIIRNKTGFSQGHLNRLLFDLEINGVVKQQPGRLYFRVL